MTNQQQEHPVPSGTCEEVENALTRTETAPYASMFSPWRKSMIVLITSWTTLSITFASTSIFNLTDEMARDFHTRPNIITGSNAAVIFVMGCSSFVWIPVENTVGRRHAWNMALFILLLCTIATALAPSLPAFIAFRILSGIQGTYFHVAGQTILSDLYEPAHRGTATGFFIAGSVLGPALGPCVAGMMVTFTHWRAVFWLQTAMIGTSLVLSTLTIPSVQQNTRTSQDMAPETQETTGPTMNFFHVFKVMAHPKVVLVQLTCGLLSWSQYTLLAAPRRLINPRFNLTTPLVAGLFYIAPGIGFLIGTIVGGKFSDVVVVRWIQRRKGQRLPQDRIRSSVLVVFGVVPAASLVYGWGLQMEVGGLALPIVSAFVWAMGLLAAFASVNTYCGVLPRERGAVIAGKYFIQYGFSSLGIASVIPMIDAIGVGLASTIGVLLVLVGGIFIIFTIQYSSAPNKAPETEKNTEREKSYAGSAARSVLL